MNQQVYLTNMFPDYEPPEELRAALSQAAIVAADIFPETGTVETVVHALGLEERIARSNGSIYIDRNYRLLFVNESLTDQEKILVMAHEEGHYYCGHKSGNKAISNGAAPQKKDSPYIKAAVRAAQLINSMHEI